MNIGFSNASNRDHAMDVVMYKARGWEPAGADIFINKTKHRATFVGIKNAYGPGWCIKCNDKRAFGRTQVEAAWALAAQIAEVAR